MYGKPIYALRKFVYQKCSKKFYVFWKFKPHFIDQPDNLITVGKFDIIELILREDELMVDFADDYDEDDIIVDL